MLRGFGLVFWRFQRLVKMCVNLIQLNIALRYTRALLRLNASCMRRSLITSLVPHVKRIAGLSCLLQWSVIGRSENAKHFMGRIVHGASFLARFAQVIIVAIQALVSNTHDRRCITPITSVSIVCHSLSLRRDAKNDMRWIMDSRSIVLTYHTEIIGTFQTFIANTFYGHVTRTAIKSMVNRILHGHRSTRYRL